MALDDDLQPHFTPEGDQAADSSLAPAAERVLRCRRCAQPMARPADAIDASGCHVHTFVNPAAEEFRIGCFRELAGPAALADRETFWSWFPGWAWRVTLCGTCGAHVGWAFERDAARFYGLILDRLAE
jgi:hypothetical protein